MLFGMLSGYASDAKRWCRLAMTLGIFTAFTVSQSQECHSDSRYTHACLHTFLERDFPQIQGYLEEHSQEFRGRRKLILEGPTLDNNCQVLEEMFKCYEEATKGCTHYYYMRDYDRFMRAFRSLQDFFCAGTKAGIKAFLKNAACVEKFRKRVSECDNPELQWPLVWAQIFRLQKNSESVCDALKEQKTCMLKWLPRSDCGDEGMDMYNTTMTTWLDSWCNSVRAISASAIFCLVAALFALFV